MGLVVKNRSRFIILYLVSPSHHVAWAVVLSFFSFAERFSSAAKYQVKLGCFCGDRDRSLHVLQEIFYRYRPSTCRSRVGRWCAR